MNFLGKFILENAPLALVLYAPLWLPQIISNVFSGAKRVPKLGYIYFFSFMRLYPFVRLELILSSTSHCVLKICYKFDPALLMATLGSLLS